VRWQEFFRSQQNPVNLIALVARFGPAKAGHYQSCPDTERCPGGVAGLLSRVPKSEAPGAPMFVLGLDARKDILAIWLPAPVPNSEGPGAPVFVPEMQCGNERKSPA